MAPTVYYEQLEYDVRLFNQAFRGGKQDILLYQKLLINSDKYLDPQALILDPENVISISQEIVKGNSYLDAGIRGALKGLNLIEGAIQSGKLRSSEMENVWINMIREELHSIPSSEDLFIQEMTEKIEKGRFIPGEYGL